jgi:chromosome segregation protein
LARQDDERRVELSELETQAQLAEERIATAEAEVAECLAILQEKQGLVAAAQGELDTHEKQRDALSQQIAELQARAFDLATQAAERENRLPQIEEQRTSLLEERAKQQDALAKHQARQEELEAQISTLTEERARLVAQVEAMEGEGARLDVALTDVEARQSELRRAQADAQQGVEQLRSRLEMLTRLREEGEGLRPGVQAVLQASRKVQYNALSGVIGTVSQLLKVPEEYEAAIEVALGGHLQDLVVESWSDAEAAISLLREQKKGRATFLPLETMRPFERLEVPDDKGVIGVGADLVLVQTSLTKVVEMLLGRTIVVRDLPAARRVFGKLRGGFQIVTLLGEVLRSSGSVTGGRSRNRAQGQVLAREREWRELPKQLAKAEEKGRGVETALSEAYGQESSLRDERASLATRLRDTEKDLGRVEGQRAELDQEAQRMVQQIEWRQGLHAQLAQQAADLDQLEIRLASELETFAADRKVAESQVVDLQAKLDQLRGEILYQRLSEARTEEAVARGTWEHRQSALDALREGKAQIDGQMNTRGERIAVLGEERASLVEQIEAQHSQEGVIQGWLAGLAQKIEPAEAEIAALESQREALESEEATLRAQLRQAENSNAQAVLAHSRQEDRLERLRRQIMDDFGLVEMEPTEGLFEQPPLPLGEMVSALPVVEILPDGIEEEIHQIKAQMRRMGSVNPTAPEEYAETLDRYTFLSSQASDLDEAATSLREVIAELDVVMREEFSKTFDQVAASFSSNFTQLFGGGTASLLLTDPEDVSSTGVDVMARPPGKRQQTLALLSGGERSLTAVALIFALLAVSPPPFCILDEVDAMLDEANVARFRQALQALTDQTQFIIITHNRGTIQVADTIYGVSMGDDSVSQVVSLRFEDNRLATEEGVEVDVRAK